MSETKSRTYHTCAFYMRERNIGCTALNKAYCRKTVEEDCPFYQSEYERRVRDARYGEAESACRAYCAKHNATYKQPRFMRGNEK